ncbi:hypothetical protein ACFSJ3_05440 [Corallincola platygyrae]|uniref:Uncharacterized protein n=1 Tax=Corallincola platygyrae TaxID=1193278 RepID=A0ABW4XIQ8_9GAMM
MRIKNRYKAQLQGIVSLLVVMLLSACVTQGKLEYVTAEGEHKTACEVEYSGAPSVDIYAVEYVLSYCARKAAEEGHQVLDPALLTNDLSIVAEPNGETWTFESATARYRAGELTDKQYGYLVAHIDLGLNQTTEPNTD